MHAPLVGDGMLAKRLHNLASLGLVAIACKHDSGIGTVD